MTTTFLAIVIFLVFVIWWHRRLYRESLKDSGSAQEHGFEIRENENGFYFFNPKDLRGSLYFAKREWAEEALTLYLKNGQKFYSKDPCYRGYEKAKTVTLAHYGIF